MDIRRRLERGLARWQGKRRGAAVLVSLVDASGKVVDASGKVFIDFGQRRDLIRTLPCICPSQMHMPITATDTHSSMEA